MQELGQGQDMAGQGGIQGDIVTVFFLNSIDLGQVQYKGMLCRVQDRAGVG